MPWEDGLTTIRSQPGGWEVKTTQQRLLLLETGGFGKFAQRSLPGQFYQDTRGCGSIEEM